MPRANPGASGGGLSAGTAHHAGTGAAPKTFARSPSFQAENGKRNPPWSDPGCSFAKRIAAYCGYAVVGLEPTARLPLWEHVGRDPSA